MTDGIQNRLDKLEPRVTKNEVDVAVLATKIVTHVEGCERKSSLILKMVFGILATVLAGLILQLWDKLPH